MPEAAPAAAAAPVAAPAAPAALEAPAAAPKAPEAKTEATGTPEAKVEPKAEVKPEPTKGESNIAKLARIRREEGAVRRRESEFRAREEAFKTREIALSESLKKAELYDQAEKLAQTDRRGFLKMAGIKFEDLANDVIKGDTRSPEQVANDAIAAFKQELKAERDAETKKAQTIAQEQRDAQMIETSKLSMRKIAEDSPDKYELVVMTESYDRAWKHVEDFWAKTEKATGKGMVLDFREALEAEENRLRSRRDALKPKAVEKKPEANAEKKVDPKVSAAGQQVLDRMAERQRGTQAKAGENSTKEKRPKVAAFLRSHSRQLLEQLAVARDQ